MEEIFATTVSSWRLKVTFWGVRGTVPTPTAKNLGYGGNTSCLEVALPSGERFIFDAGSGIRSLSSNLTGDVNLFLTHFHWDHIQGLPVFTPLFEPGRLLRIFSSQFTAPLKDSLANQMLAPYFPVDYSDLASTRELVELDSQGYRSGKLSVTPFALNHPQGSCGYRIESEGAVIIYATDHEHGNPKFDAGLVDVARGADVLIHDSQYTPEEKVRYRGRGHSSWQESAATAREARVKQLMLFHHDPEHDDDQVTRIVSNARQHFENADGAREGMSITL